LAFGNVITTVGSVSDEAEVRTEADQLIEFWACRHDEEEKNREKRGRGYLQREERHEERKASVKKMTRVCLQKKA